MVQKVKQVFQLTQFAGRTTNIAVCGSKLGGISAEGSRRFRGQTTIRSPRMHDGNLAAQEVLSGTLVLGLLVFVGILMIKIPPFFEK